MSGISILAALSRYDERFGSSALGVCFVIIGASLLIRGAKADVGPFQSRTIRWIGCGQIALGFLLASPITADVRTCRNCSSSHAADYLWAGFVAIILLLNLKRIWGRRRP